MIYEKLRYQVTIKDVFFILIHIFIFNKGYTSVKQNVTINLIN